MPDGAADRWAAVGAAVAVLVCAIVFEAAPVAWKLSAYVRSQGTAGQPVLLEVEL